jgi:molybdate transport system ATP-binding protein
MLSLSLERDAREVLFPIRIHLETDAQIIALSGPSGAGKTSILKMMAGLLPPDRGHFSVAGTVLFDSEKRIALPAWNGASDLSFRIIDYFRICR